MTDGLVSIITSVYNSEKFIGRAIESVLAQTYENWEMIVTDDCSTDGGAEIVERYAAADPRIKLLRMTENGGPGRCRNNSIQNANGRYIAILDSDDKWLPDKLEKQLRLMREKDCGMVHSSYYVCDEDGRVDGLVRCKRTVRYWRMVCDNTIGFLTMMYDRTKTGDLLMPTIRKRQDWGFNIMLLKVCRVAYGVDEPLAVYTIRENSISRDKLSLTKYNIAIYNEVLHYPRLKSVLMFYCVFAPFYSGKKILNYVKTHFFTQRYSIPES